MFLPIADALSRLVEESVGDVNHNHVTASAEDEQYINWAVAQAEPKAIKFEEIGICERYPKIHRLHWDNLFKNSRSRSGSCQNFRFLQKLIVRKSSTVPIQLNFLFKFSFNFLAFSRFFVFK